MHLSSDKRPGYVFSRDNLIDFQHQSVRGSKGGEEPHSHLWFDTRSIVHRMRADSADQRQTLDTILRKLTHEN